MRHVKSPKRIRTVDSFAIGANVTAQSIQYCCLLPNTTTQSNFCILLDPHTLICKPSRMCSEIYLSCFWSFLALSMDSILEEVAKDNEKDGVSSGIKWF